MHNWAVFYLLRIKEGVCVFATRLTTAGFISSDLMCSVWLRWHTVQIHLKPRSCSLAPGGAWPLPRRQKDPVLGFGSLRGFNIHFPWFSISSHQLKSIIVDRENHVQQRTRADCLQEGMSGSLYSLHNEKESVKWCKWHFGGEEKKSNAAVCVLMYETKARMWHLQPF